MRTRLVLIRHGEHDPGGRFLQHGCEGLTPRGRRQARRLAVRLAADRDMRLDVLLSSRAARTIETAAEVGRQLGVATAAPTCDLCEMHPGDAEGLTPSQMSRRFGPTYAYVPGAEHYPDWVPTAVRRLRQLAATHEAATVGCVAHTAVILASFGGLAQVPIQPSGPPEATSITMWSRPAGDPNGPWRLDVANDHRHLHPG